MIRRRGCCYPYSATILERFFSRTVTLTAPALAIRPAHLDDAHPGGCINAAPAFSSGFASCNRFFSGAVTLKASHAGLRLGKFYDFSVNAGPARSTAICARFLFGAESLTASGAALCFGRLNDLSIDATPPNRWRTGRQVNWRRSGLRTGASRRRLRLRRRTIQIGSTCGRENEIQAW